MKKSVMFKLISSVLFVGCLGFVSTVSAMNSAAEHGGAFVDPDDLDDVCAVEASVYNLSLSDESKRNVFTKIFRTAPKLLSEGDQLAMQSHFDKLEFDQLQAKITTALTSTDEVVRQSMLYYCAQKADETSHPIFVHVFVKDLVRKAYISPDDLTEQDKTLLLSAMIIEMIHSCLSACIAAKYFRLSVGTFYNQWREAFAPIKAMLPVLIPGQYLTEVVKLVTNRYRADNFVMSNPSWPNLFKSWAVENIGYRIWPFNLPVAMEYKTADVIKNWDELDPAKKSAIVKTVWTTITSSLVVEFLRITGDRGVALTAKKNHEIWAYFFDLDLFTLTMQELEKAAVKARAAK